MEPDRKCRQSSMVRDAAHSARTESIRDDPVESVCNKGLSPEREPRFKIGFDTAFRPIPGQ